MTEPAGGDDGVGSPPPALNLVEDEKGAPAAAVGTPQPGRRHTIDSTRELIAGALVGLLAIVTLGAVVYVMASPGDEPAVEALLKLVFTPIIGLVGSVVGFYFGAQSEKDKPGS
jgi:Asp/Glu/hydantoin racemase